MDNGANTYHWIIGSKKSRVKYYKRDWIDYILMTAIGSGLTVFVYGLKHPLTIMVGCISLFMVIVFPIRHGFQLTIPLIFKKPGGLIYLLIYKLLNIKLPLVLAVAFLSLENMIIAWTPEWPHQEKFMYEMAMGLFYTHLVLTALFRTYILLAHLRKKELVRAVLLQSPWKSFISKQKNIRLEICHAYATGMLTHILYLAPWYWIITHVEYSLLLLPFGIVISLIIETRFNKVLNDWFYRDHWLGHNSEVEFVYLHGTHHDAIPCALIGVGENGHLEGVFRQIIGFPVIYYNPLVAFVLQSIGSYGNMIMHQYIPGIFPGIARNVEMHHSVHHYGKLEPYSVGGFYGGELLKRFPDELKYALKLDQQLTGYRRENKTYRWYLDLLDKYSSITP